MKSVFQTTIITVLAFLTSNVFYLALISLMPLLSEYDDPYGYVIHMLIFAATFVYFRKHVQPYIEHSITRAHLLMLVPYMFIISIRFPILYPTADDMAGHFMFGDYARTIWLNHHFMPLHLSTYFYPAVDMLYTPFLFLIGLRMTIFLFYVVVTIWMVSLYGRFLKRASSNPERLLVTAFFLLIPYIPHLIAIHGTLMVDYLALAITIESLYQFTRKQSDYTFATFTFLLTLIVKQSTAIFFTPLFLYFVYLRWKKMRWHLIFGFVAIVLIYFVKLQIETGNLLFGLYNGIFKSALYDVGNFRDQSFGPLTQKDALLWPVIGQFTDRFGQGFTTPLQRYFFAWIMIVPFFGSLIMAITMRSMKYTVFFVCYILWIAMSGYSRYVIPLNVLVILSLIEDIKWPSIKSLQKANNRTIVAAGLLVIWVLALSSMKTDFSWRPTLNVFSYREHNHFLATALKDGSKMLFRDTMGAYIDEQRPVFAGYDAIVPIYRGDATFLAYLGSKNTIPVIKALTVEEKERVLSDPKISSEIKARLLQLDKKSRVILLVEKSHESVYYLDRDQAIHETFDCTRVGQHEQSRYFQARNQFNEIVIYDCNRKTAH